MSLGFVAAALAFARRTEGFELAVLGSEPNFGKYSRREACSVRENSIAFAVDFAGTAAAVESSAGITAVIAEAITESYFVAVAADYHDLSAIRSVL